MRMYQYDKHLDFHALGREIKRKREAKGWTQEYLAQLVDRTPRSIMYMENRGQKPSLNVFFQLVTLLEISVDQFFFPDKLNGESTCRKQIDVMLNSMDEKELTVMYACMGSRIINRAPFCVIAFSMRSSERVSSRLASSITSTRSRSASASIKRGLTVSPSPSSAVW